MWNLMKIFFTSIEFIRVATEGFMESLGMRLGFVR